MLDTTQPDVQFALHSVREACDLAQQIQAGMKVEGIAKGDLSPVTVADFAVQALVGRAIANALPGAVLVGEEKADMLRQTENADTLQLVADFVGRFTDGAEPEQVCDWIDRGAAEPGDAFWTLDPVDGTKGYLRGGQYAIALARIENGAVTFGALGCPNLGQDCQESMGTGMVALAEAGKGAWYSVAGGDFVAMKASPETNPKNARLMRSVESGHTNVGELDHIADHIGVAAEPVRMDSQAKYAVLAAGGGEMLFRLLSPGKESYKECIWDQAAGSIVLQEAGGKITDLKGNPLDFAHGRKLTQNTGVFASNGHLHDAGLEAINAICTLPA